MTYRRIVFFAFITLETLSSCYHRKLNYSFEPSYGGVISGSTCYYLAQVREFQMPKGISTLPDGGISRDVRQLFGLFKTDTLSNSTVLITRLGNVMGWPSRYSTRLERNNSLIAIGIENITQPDSVSGIYLYNLKSGKLIKYSKEVGLPALSKGSSLIAYCIKNRLVVEDYSTKTKLFSYLLNFVPVFITWENDNEINIYFSDPFRVMVLDINTGRVSESKRKYIKNYDQEIDINKLNRIFKGSVDQPKDILDKNY